MLDVGNDEVRGEARYARSGPINLAYQTMGDSPIDVLYLAPGISRLSLAISALRPLPGSPRRVRPSGGL